MCSSILKIKMLFTGLGFVALWDINLCGLSNAKAILLEEQK